MDNLILVYSYNYLHCFYDKINRKIKIKVEKSEIYDKSCKRL